MQKSVHSSDYRALREELRRLRTGAGLSQRELAAELGVAHSWVAKVESGERRVDLIEFLWFVAACQADPVAAIKRLLKSSVSTRTSSRR
jgi:transcriptional regulator with XRE-family HTH domain